MINFVKDLKELKKEDVNIAGGKAVSLGELISAGIMVPSGFCVLTNAFEVFLKKNNLKEEIDFLLHEINHEDINSVEKSSQKIRSLILNSKISEKLEKEILLNFKKLNSKFVAVRSSATAEDSKIAAWAGQLETYLNTTEKTLLENVKKCWASLFTPRAIFYRFEKNFHKQKVSVGVVIQEMIDSEVSGVAFSVHPVTGSGNQILIEACFGLGEALVSGQITPDNYVVEKSIWKLINKTNNHQSKALIKSKKGGTEWKILSEEVCKQQKLTEKEIIYLAKLINKLEIYFGFMIDVEWVKIKDKFFIVQSRPVTTSSNNKETQLRFEKFFNRQLSLFSIQYWWKAEYNSLPKFLERATRFNPLFIHNKGRAVDVYYDVISEKTSPLPLIEYFKRKPKIFDKFAKKYRRDCSKLLKSCKNKSKDFSKIYNIIVKDSWPMLSIIMVLGKLIEERGVVGTLARKAYKLRKNSEKVIYRAGFTLYSIAKMKFPELVEYLNLLKKEEIISGKLPTLDELDKRRNGFIYFEGHLYTGNEVKNFEKKNNLVIVQEKIEEKNKGDVLRGTSAMKGKIKGKVKLLFEISQVKEVKKGDIIVSPMTTPDFLPAMKKAVAFVTDEGGVTCHASITAREMGKPCIIGTKIATKVLKDGDLVEVDANRGIVRLLKRKL